MVILNLKKINPQKLKDGNLVNSQSNGNLNNIDFENILIQYENILNFDPIICPSCGSSYYIRWGFYERNVIYSKDGILLSKVIKVQRVKCKGCNCTHALMPDGIIPYKQFVLKVIIDCLIHKTPYEISQNLIYKWSRQFKKIFMPLLRTCFINKVPYQMNDMINFELDRKQFLIRNNRYFFQIKLLHIAYAPS